MHRFDLSEINLDDHEAEAAALFCVDRRFLKVQRRYVREVLKIKTFDPYGFPGGGKNLVKRSALRTKIVKAIRVVSFDLHKAKKIVAFLHADCAAYGGTKYFGSSHAEAAQYRKDLAKVKKFLAKEFPDAEIICVYSNVNGHGLEFHSV